MTKSTSGYTEAIGLEICEQVTAGKVLATICADEGMPSSRTVLRWLRDHPEFAVIYDRARQSRADAWAEEIIQISDDTSQDYTDKERSDGSTARVLDAEHVQRSRLRIDARKWLMGKAAPKRYGDHMTVDQTSEVTLKQDVDLSHLSKKEREVWSALVVKARRAAGEKASS